MFFKGKGKQQYIVDAVMKSMQDNNDGGKGPKTPEVVIKKVERKTPQSSVAQPKSGERKTPDAVAAQPKSGERKTTPAAVASANVSPAIAALIAKMKKSTTDGQAAGTKGTVATQIELHRSKAAAAGSKAAASKEGTVTARLQAHRAKAKDT